MKILKLFIALTMIMILSIPIAATSPKNDDLTITPRGSYSFSANVYPNQSVQKKNISFNTTAGYAEIDCTSFVGTTGNKVYFTLNDSYGNPVSETGWIDSTGTLTLKYKSTAPSYVANGSLRIQGSYSNSGYTSVSGMFYPD